MKKNIMFIVPIFILLISCDNGTAQAESKSKNLSNKKDLQSKIKKDSKSNSENAILAPDFTLADLKGQKISLSDLKGKVVLLNFWGTWCGPCKREIPDFVSLSKKHKKNGLEIIGVTLSSGSPEKIQDFSQKWKINYTLLTDINGNETQSVTARYGQATSQPITGIPTTFIIDRDGYIRQRYVGPRSEEVFFKDLEPYL
ncbi:MAG: peroxiredoxin family protein [Candidatus Neomarinimicrobiota bacterium]